MGRRYGHREEWATVVAYDPGGTSGWAVMAAAAAGVGSGASLKSCLRHSVSGEIVGTLRKQCKEIIDLIEHWPDAAVVGEDFTIRQFNQAEHFLHPVRINAVVQYVTGPAPGKNEANGNAPRTIFMQQPAMAKSTISDESLKSHGVYHHNSPHARDATRHAMTFLRRAIADPKLRIKAWPHLFSEDAQEVVVA